MASKTAHKGELWFQVLAGKSPKEQAIIYLITLTIPLWKSIRFLLWIAAQEQPEKESILCGTFNWNTLGRAIVSTEAGGVHICEKSCRTALCQAQDSFLLQRHWRHTRPFLWRGSRGTQSCVLGEADSTSIFDQSLPVGKAADTW